MTNGDERNETEWAEIESGIRLDGFASVECEKLRPILIASLGGWHAPARRLNRFAMRHYALATTMLNGLKLGDPIARGVQLFARCLSAYQAALILIERGAGIEAQVQVRTIYETAFWMAFLANDPKRAEAQLLLKANNNRRRRSQAVLAARSYVDEEIREAAMEVIRDVGPKKKEEARDLDLGEIAKLSGCSLEYLHYLDLSDSAAHASLASIFPYLSRDELGAYNGHQFGPNAEAADKAIKLGSHALFSALSHLARLTSMPFDQNEYLAIHDDFNRLDSPTD